jgi:predicted peroxiredoxin
MKRFCVSLTYAKNDTDKATVAFVVPNAAAASDKDAMVFLSTEAVRLSQQGCRGRVWALGRSQGRVPA